MLLLLFSKAIKHYMLDLSVCTERFDSWAGMALARHSRLENKLSAVSCHTSTSDRSVWEMFSQLCHRHHFWQTPLGMCSTKHRHQSLQCESKKIPPEGTWHFLIFFINVWEFLIDFLHTYYKFLFTLDYKFLFNHPQFWRSYAILSASTISHNKRKMFTIGRNACVDTFA